MMMAISGLVLNKNFIMDTKTLFLLVPYWISCPTRNVLLLSRWKKYTEDNWLKSTLIYALLLGSILKVSIKKWFVASGNFSCLLKKKAGDEIWV
jgi:hypothetical protein